MSAETATTTTETREVLAPEGTVWVDGYKDITGYWGDVEEAKGAFDQAHIHYPVISETHDTVIYVPADEPAAKADLMMLAGEVYYLRQNNAKLRLTLTTVLASLKHYLDSERLV